MSASVNPTWLQTRDFPENPPIIRLTDADLTNYVVKKRIYAAKSIAPAPTACRTPARCAEFALARHRPGTRTLVIANTVPRAREIFRAIRPKFPDVILLHSRFRPGDRKSNTAALNAIPLDGQIVVATQVLEAGVDISSRLLITDIAPWGSLVQRFGRVNRYGEDESSEIWWVDMPTYTKQKDPTAPYAKDEIERAKERLTDRTSAASADLPEEDGPEPWQHVLRRSDLLDLFDTTSDLSGNELDISRFIRATEDKNVYLAWREWEGERPSKLSEVEDDELCPVPVVELREYSKKHPVFTWNFATEEWAEVDGDRFYPGMTAITKCAEGGYTAVEGWSPESKTKVEAATQRNDEPDDDSNDPLSFPQYRQTLRNHTERVVDELEVLLATQNLEEEYAAALRTAATKHDWGKAHEVFQATLHRNDTSSELLAKQIGNAKHSRKHFRHELASALAMLQTGDSDLSAYLVAAHHGKIRLGIRSMPGETEEGRVRTARGIQEGDHLPACELATGVLMPQVKLSLTVMEFGAEGGSWTDRMLRLRDNLGPFRLAYLEMMLRAADEKATADPRLEVPACID